MASQNGAEMQAKSNAAAKKDQPKPPRFGYNQAAHKMDLGRFS